MVESLILEESKMAFTYSAVAHDFRFTFAVYVADTGLLVLLANGIRTILPFTPPGELHAFQAYTSPILGDSIKLIFQRKTGTFQTYVVESIRGSRPMKIEVGDSALWKLQRYHTTALDNTTTAWWPQELARVSAPWRAGSARRRRPPRRRRR